MSLQLEFVVKAVDGKIISQKDDQFKSYAVDNRDPDIQGKLFIPLVGEAHDAHKFVAAAVEAGAGGVLFHQWDEAWEPLKSKASFIQVKDTLKALQQLAKAWRQNFSGQVLGLTGSNGKTTTKDFLFQLLENFGSVNASKGSFNNHWGVPFTLLDSPSDLDFCVVEMGMNHAGEISQLMSIADPDKVMVTNVGRAHMGNFENGIEGVAAAKQEIYENAKARAQLIFNIDNPYTRKMYQKFMDKPSFTFSTQNFSADVYFKLKKQTATGMEIEGQIGGVLGKAQVQFWGEHNIQNLAAAVAMAYMAGCKPEKLWPLLETCSTGWGRNQWLESEQGASILFDGYNANPDSFKELIGNITPMFTGDKKIIGIFGEMLELGSQTSAEHEKLGELMGQFEWEQCWFIGPSNQDFLAGWKRSDNQKNPVIANTYEETLDLDLTNVLNQQFQFIVKGSRGGALERAVQRLKPKSFSSK